MIYKEITAVCSQTHTKYVSSLCGQTAELLNVKTGGTYSNHWVYNWQIRLVYTLSLSTQGIT